MLLEKNGEKILLIKGDWYFVNGIDGVPMLHEIHENGCVFILEDASNYPEVKTTTYVAKFEDIEGACPF